MSMIFQSYAIWPNMTVADPEAATRAAYAQAYKSARARADAYAQAAGLKVSRVLAIRDQGDGQNPIPYYGAAVGSVVTEQAAAAPPRRPGMTTSEVRVRVDFALSEK